MISRSPALGVKRGREGESAGRAEEGLAQKACEIVKVILKYFTIVNL